MQQAIGLHRTVVDRQSTHQVIISYFRAFEANVLAEGAGVEGIDMMGLQSFVVPDIHIAKIFIGVAADCIRM